MTADDAADVADALEREFGFRLEDDQRRILDTVHRPRFNVSPGDDHWVLRMVRGNLRVMPARWGLAIGDTGRSSINARAETLNAKPTFAPAADRGRAVVVADGFYEWDADKQPWWFTRTDGGVMLLPAICRRAPDGHPKFATVTVPAAGRVEGVHDRMAPVLCGSDSETLALWLGDADARTSVAAVRARPTPALVARPVSRYVNDPRHDDARCVAEIPTPPSQPALRGLDGVE